MKDDCWIWAKSSTAAGYGQVYLRKEGRKSINVYAHRLIWEAENGPIPKGMEVCHHCDEPSCMNPAHLFLGTHAENMQDAWRKERVDRGPNWYAANLAAAQRRKQRRRQERLKYVTVVLSIIFLLSACARVDVYYPAYGDERPQRAVVLNGTDSLGDTVIAVSHDGVRLASAGGLDNSTSTRAGYATARAGIAAAGSIAAAGFAWGAYSAHQAQIQASNVAASKAAAATAASNAAIPAAGSTIQATTPATVVPVP